MRHEDVQERQIADLYLMGRLSPVEAEEFEEHYLGCPECLEELELSEGFQAGLKRVAAEDVAKALVVRRLGLMAWLARAARSRGAGLLAAAVLLVAVLPLGALYQRERGTSAELEARLADAFSPQANVPIVALGAQRTGPILGPNRPTEIPRQSARSAPGPEGPVDRIRLPQTLGWIVLSLELADPEAFPSYRGTLLFAGGERVWQGSSLLTDPRGALAVSLHSSTLRPGDYELRVEGLSAGADPASVASFTFRVLPAGP